MLRWPRGSWATTSWGFGDPASGGARRGAGGRRGADRGGTFLPPSRRGHRVRSHGPAPPHPSTLRFEVRSPRGKLLLAEEYRSVGGGAVAGGTLGEELARKGRFTMAEILASCRAGGPTSWGTRGRTNGGGPERPGNRGPPGGTMGGDTECHRPGALGPRGTPQAPSAFPPPPDLYEAFQGLRVEVKPLAREMNLASDYAIAEAEENAAGGSPPPRLAGRQTWSWPCSGSAGASG